MRHCCVLKYYSVEYFSEIECCHHYLNIGKLKIKNRYPRRNPDKQMPDISIPSILLVTISPQLLSKYSSAEESPADFGFVFTFRYFVG